MREPTSVRFEPEQFLELQYIAHKNKHKPSTFLRLVTEQMLALCKQNGGRIPTDDQLQLVLPVVVQKKEKK